MKEENIYINALDPHIIIVVCSGNEIREIDIEELIKDAEREEKKKKK